MGKDPLQILQQGLPAPEITVPIRDSFHTARGWREVGQIYTLAENAAYPRPKAITKLIHEFDRGVIPGGILWVFRSPSDESGETDEAFYRHCIFRHVHSEHAHTFNPELQIPGSYKGPTPNFLDCILQGRVPDPRGYDLPFNMVPWDEALVAQLRREYMDDNKAGMQAFVDRVVKSDAMSAEARREEQRYINDDLQRYVNKKLETISDVDAKEYMGYQVHRAEAMVAQARAKAGS